MERCRSMVVSFVNGTSRCPGGSLSAVNEASVGFITLKPNDLQHSLANWTSLNLADPASPLSNIMTLSANAQ
jgi:hypothetical protein